VRNSAKTTQKSADRPGVIVLISFCTLILLLPCLCARGAELPAPAQLLPPETLLFAEIPNFTQFAEQFKKTSYYKLYKDPAMAPFIDDLKSKLLEEVKKSEDELFSIIFNTDALPVGKVAIGLLAGPDGGFDEPQILIIAEWGEGKGKVQDAIDKILARAADEGLRKKTEDYRGVNIISAVDESDPEFVPSYCFIDDCLFGSTHPDLLKSVIARIKGAGGASLADEADYNSAIKAVGPYHDFDFYMNLRQLKNLITAGDKSGQSKALSGSLGFDNVISFSFAAGIARDSGKDSIVKGLLRVDGEKKGICKMLELDSTSLRVPKFAPADFYSAMYFNFNFKKAFDALGRIATAISPQMAAIRYMPLIHANPDGQPGLTVRADVIDHLGAQLVSFSSLDKSASASEGPKVETIVALATSNRAGLEGSLSRLHARFSQGKPDASRQLLGHTIYTIDLTIFLPFLPGFGPSVRNMGQASPMGMPAIPKFAFTVSDTHLILGFESRVEKAIRTLSAASGSAEPPKWFRKAKAAIPDVVGFAGLQNDASSARVVWKDLKTTPEASDGDSEREIKLGVGTGGLTFSQMGLDFLDATLLPDFDAVEKYFGIQAGYGIAREDGFFFETKYINPD